MFIKSKLSQAATAENNWLQSSIVGHLQEWALVNDHVIHLHILRLVTYDSFMQITWYMVIIMNSNSLINFIEQIFIRYLLLCLIGTCTSQQTISPYVLYYSKFNQEVNVQLLTKWSLMTTSEEKTPKYFIKVVTTDYEGFSAQTSTQNSNFNHGQNSLKHFQKTQESRLCCIGTCRAVRSSPQCLFDSFAWTYTS